MSSTNIGCSQCSMVRATGLSGSTARITGTNKQCMAHSADKLKPNLSQIIEMVNFLAGKP